MSLTSVSEFFLRDSISRKTLCHLDTYCLASLLPCQPASQLASFISLLTAYNFGSGSLFRPFSVLKPTAGTNSNHFSHLFWYCISSVRKGTSTSALVPGGAFRHGGQERIGRWSACVGGVVVGKGWVFPQGGSRLQGEALRQHCSFYFAEASWRTFFPPPLPNLECGREM